MNRRDFEGVVLARHGETDYNRSRRFQGWLPVPLNARGREQAAELAERAADGGFVCMWASPLERARETAAVVAARISLPPREDARLKETETGAWTGLLFSEVAAVEPEQLKRFLAGDPEFAFPGGESFAQHRARVMEVLEEVAAGPKPALVVCHGVVIRLALSSLEGPERALAAPVENAALVPLGGAPEAA
ncbi:MAG: histidine phosphatase family protein [Solirubrobacteraceae bacterium]